MSYGPQLALFDGCPTCGRAVNPWPLDRSAKCSPHDWAYCIRNDGQRAS